MSRFRRRLKRGVAGNRTRSKAAFSRACGGRPPRQHFIFRTLHSLFCVLHSSILWSRKEEKGPWRGRSGLATSGGRRRQRGRCPAGQGGDQPRSCFPLPSFFLLPLKDGGAPASGLYRGPRVRLRLGFFGGCSFPPSGAWVTGAMEGGMDEASRSTMRMPR